MKNPFERQDNTKGILTGIILGVAAAAGGISYLYYKKKKALAEAAAYAKEHAQDYLKEKEHHLKKHKTDVHDLAAIVSH